MLKSAVVLAISGLLATTAQAAPEASAPADMKVAYTIYKRPLFSAVTPVLATFGAVGGVTMLATGTSLIDSNKVEDPAVAIATDLAKSFARARPAEVVNTPIQIKSSPRFDRMIAAADGVRYLVDVRTTYWTYTYYPFDWLHYKVEYRAHFRLIDTAEKAVVAEGWCDEAAEKPDDEPTHGELVRDGAAGLKSRLQRMGEACSAQLKSDILRLPAMPPEAPMGGASG